jgi:hypothetical protein
MESPWRVASYSDANGGACVETASGNGTVLIRDTKLRVGITLNVPASVWATFTESLR